MSGWIGKLGKGIGSLFDGDSRATWYRDIDRGYETVEKIIKGESSQAGHCTFDTVFSPEERDHLKNLYNDAKAGDEKAWGKIETIGHVYNGTERGCIRWHDAKGKILYHTDTGFQAAAERAKKIAQDGLNEKKHDPAALNQQVQERRIKALGDAGYDEIIAKTAKKKAELELLQMEKQIEALKKNQDTTTLGQQSAEYGSYAGMLRALGMNPNGAYQPFGSLYPNYMGALSGGSSMHSEATVIV